MKLKDVYSLTIYLHYDTQAGTTNIKNLSKKAWSKRKAFRGHPTDDLARVPGGGRCARNHDILYTN